MGVCTATKISFMYSFSGNCAASVSVSDLYNPGIGPHISCSKIARSIVGIYKLLIDTWTWNLGLWLHNSFSGNICFEFRYWFFSVGERHSIIYYLHMEGICTVCNFKLLQCSALLKHAFIYQPMCGGQWAQVYVIQYSLMTPSRVLYRLIQNGGFACLPASQSQPRKCRLFPNPLVTWPRLSPGWFKMADCLLRQLSILLLSMSV